MTFSLHFAVPLELPVIKREHFNRWYSARAYFISLTIADIPVQVLCTVVYILITYLMTGQPLEVFRFAGFFSVNLLVCFVAQGLGLLCGSIFNVKLGTIFGTFFICPFLIFSGFFVQLKHAHHLTHWMFHISFLKYALEGTDSTKCLSPAKDLTDFYRFVSLFRRRLHNLWLQSRKDRMRR
jgi:ATP-binding cassette, subfamily G (WHITE), member 1